MSSYNVCGFISYFPYQVLVNFSSGSNGKESAFNAGDQGSVPRMGRSPGEGNGNLLQYSGLGNTMDRDAWQATVLKVAKESDTT